MRTRFAPSLLLLAVVGIASVACGGEGTPDPKSPTVAKTSGGSGDGKGLKPGDKAPAFTLDSMNGAGKMTVAPNKVTIVDFWATWCEPCKKSFPKLQELYVRYKSNGLEIVAVSVDDDKTGITDFVKIHGAKLPVGWDDGHKIAEQWKPDPMPTSYIVGKDGLVKHVHRGFHDGDEVEIEKQLKALF